MEAQGSVIAPLSSPRAMAEKDTCLSVSSPGCVGVPFRCLYPRECLFWASWRTLGLSTFSCVAFPRRVLGCRVEGCPQGSANTFWSLVPDCFDCFREFSLFSSQLSHALNFILIQYLYALCCKTFWCRVLSMVENRGLSWIFIFQLK